MFKLIAATFAALLALAAAKPGLVGAPVAYSAPVVGGPVVSAYSAVSPFAAYSAPYAAPVVSPYVAGPLAYSAHRPVAYLG